MHECVTVVLNKPITTTDGAYAGSVPLNTSSLTLHSNQQHTNTFLQHLQPNRIWTISLLPFSFLLSSDGVRWVSPAASVFDLCRWHVMSSKSDTKSKQNTHAQPYATCHRPCFLARSIPGRSLRIDGPDSLGRATGNPFYFGSVRLAPTFRFMIIILSSQSS